MFPDNLLRFLMALNAPMPIALIALPCSSFLAGGQVEVPVVSK